MESKIIWVYGTLKTGYGNHYLLQPLTSVKSDYVLFHKLTWVWFPIVTFAPEAMILPEDVDSNQKMIGSKNQNPQTMTTEKKKVIKIELYEVTDENMLARLDSLEWHPRWYRRTPIKTLSGESIEIYNMPLDQNTSQSSEAYMAQMFEKEDDNFIYYNWNR